MTSKPLRGLKWHGDDKRVFMAAIQTHYRADKEFFIKENDGCIYGPVQITNTDWGDVNQPLEAAYVDGHGDNRNYWVYSWQILIKFEKPEDF